MKTCLLFAAVLFVLILALESDGFEISAYWDARAYVRLNSQWGLGLGNCNNDYWWPGGPARIDSLDWAVWFSAVEAANQDVIQYYHELGLTNLCVYYKNEDFDLWTDSTFKLMNDLAPGDGFKYLHAYDRDVRLADTSDIYNFGRGTYASQGDCTHVVSAHVYNATENVFTLMIQPTAGVGATFWQPAHYPEVPDAWSPFGEWNGWQQRGCEWPNTYMSFHVMVRAKLDADSDPTELVATLYWYVEDQDSATRRDWRRYPGIKINKSDFNPNNPVFDTLRYEIFPENRISNSGNLLSRALWDTTHFVEPYFRPCDENFDTLNAGNVYDSTGNWSVQCHMFGGAPSLGGSNRVAFKIVYSGHHTLYVHDVEVWDEGYHRLFNADPDTIAHYQNEIVAAHQTQMTHAHGQLATWYYDEFDNGAIPAWVQTNKILQNAGLPTRILNGWNHRNDNQGPRDSLFYRLDNESVHIPVMMCEFYPYGGDSMCQPAAHVSDGQTDPPGLAWVDASSDVAYWRHQPNTCGITGYPSFSHSVLSLQASLDLNIWGIYPFLNATDVAPQFGEGYYYPGFLGQCQFAKNHGDHSTTFWALLQGDADGTAGPNTNAYWRAPTPGEIKLEAWLAAACDANGIMWYWAFGGLLKWRDDATFCTPGGASVEQTERYSAAQKACTDIQLIAPILDSLRFVKTYASRAFELDYPDSTYEATQLDILATNCSWYGQNYRSVCNILAWAPDTSRGEFAWSENPESHPYMQVSRFRNPLVNLYDPDFEDYWFLIVNRRALAGEQRKIRLVVEIDSDYLNYPYYLDYMLGDSMGVAGPCMTRVPQCAVRFIDVVLQPGEAELVHFYRGFWGCDTTLAVIDSLAISVVGPHAVRLDWEEITETDWGQPFQVDTYFICGSPRVSGPYTPIGVATTNTYIDSIFFQAYNPDYYYVVQACGPASR